MGIPTRPRFEAILLGKGVQVNSDFRFKILASVIFDAKKNRNKEARTIPHSLFPPPVRLSSRPKPTPTKRLFVASPKYTSIETLVETRNSLPSGGATLTRLYILLQRCLMSRYLFPTPTMQLHQTLFKTFRFSPIKKRAFFQQKSTITVI